MKANFFQHAFPNGSFVTLTATPPDFAQAYGVKWTGACSGTITQDQHCYLSFAPTSLCRLLSVDFWIFLEL
jgi:hypothetical protein